MAHDIKLEVAGSDSRVEIRLSERGGEVKVAVRTADASLAGSLRDNLPALASKLADNGFKTETLAHLGCFRRRAASHDRIRAGPDLAEIPNSSPNSKTTSKESGQRHPKAPQQLTSENEKGRDFEWLMSTLR